MSDVIWWAAKGFRFFSSFSSKDFHNRSRLYHAFIQPNNWSLRRSNWKRLYHHICTETCSFGPMTLTQQKWSSRHATHMFSSHFFSLSENYNVNTLGYIWHFVSTNDEHGQRTLFNLIRKIKKENRTVCGQKRQHENWWLIFVMPFVNEICVNCVWLDTNVCDLRLPWDWFNNGPNLSFGRRRLCCSFIHSFNC